jgi:hypothetical protein
MRDWALLLLLFVLGLVLYGVAGEIATERAIAEQERLPLPAQVSLP